VGNQGRKRRTAGVTKKYKPSDYERFLKTGQYGEHLKKWEMDFTFAMAQPPSTQSSAEH
jgi:hypothetical protein